MKNIYEVLNEFQQASTHEQRLDALRRNDTKALRCILRATFHPRIIFVLTEIPTYRPNDSPVELSGNNLHNEVDRIYLFEENNPRVDPNLTLKRREIILTQILESLETKEAEVFVKMFQKNLQIPELTYELVDEAFPGVLA